MNDARREFIKKHHKSIICEPSGLTLEEFKEKQIQKIKIINELVEENNE